MILREVEIGKSVIISTTSPSNKEVILERVCEVLSLPRMNRSYWIIGFSEELDEKDFFIVRVEMCMSIMEFKRYCKLELI